MWSVNVVDETFVTVPPAELAAVFADPAAWRRFWPDLRLAVFADRGEQGLRWTVEGPLVGTMEVWLEPVLDGTVLHYFLRADPTGPGGAARPLPPRRARAEVARRQHAAKAVALGLKARLERGRPPGEPRRSAPGPGRCDGSPCPPGGSLPAMAEESTQSITIDASPKAIMAVIADFAAYPEWTNAVTSTEVLARDGEGRAKQVHFELDAGVVQDTYVLAYDWAPDGLSVRWRLVKGQMQRSQRGSYVLRPGAGGTEVTYTLSVDLTIPMIGMFRRKAERVIMDTALEELKRRVEVERRYDD